MHFEMYMQCVGVEVDQPFESSMNGEARYV